ncbi:MATE family efflux transporter [Clostridium sp. 'deep sea']|uniref:MATE family efflux transporter n=1 Tax=Clostridium sp. 'deep sea' TaxID=2779445 RepID=UPI0018965AA5|nr:MATE family efflux transporter [Clostridium sp. 'deep sea']QOR34239.1 MATE family efflux transporter [Clostridium sp. 'deep sea']
MKRDLTKGSISKNLMYMAIPAILGSLAQTIYSLVDMFWIGKISATAVAAVTVFSSVFFLVWVLSSIIGISSVSLISQNFGSGNKKRTAKVIEQTIVFKALMAFVTLAIMYFALKPLLWFLSDEAEVVQYALDYGLIRVIFLPISFVSATLINAMRCVGDSKRPMIISIVCAFLNVILDPIFMFKTVPFIGISGFGMGIKGAAVATAISNLVMFVYGFIILLGGYSNIKIKLAGLFKLDKEIDTQLVMIGLPVGVEMTAREVAGIVIMKFLATYGTPIIAAFGITFRLTSFAFTVMMGLSNGGGAIVGQNLGAENIDRAEKTAYVAAKIGFVVLGTLTLVSVFLAPNIIRAFIKDPLAIASGRIILPLLMVGATGFCIALCLACVFGGSGYNFPFVVSSIIARWIIQIPWLYLTVKVWHMPYIWAAFSYVAAEITEAIILIWFFKKGKWKTHRVSVVEGVVD